MMTLVRRTLSIVKASSRALSAHPRLVVFPAISAAASVVILASFAVPLIWLVATRFGGNTWGDVQTQWARLVWPAAGDLFGGVSFFFSGFFLPFLFYSRKK